MWNERIRKSPFVIQCDSTGPINPINDDILPSGDRSRTRTTVPAQNGTEKGDQWFKPPNGKRISTEVRRYSAGRVTGVGEEIEGGNGSPVTSATSNFDVCSSFLKRFR